MRGSDETSLNSPLVFCTNDSILSVTGTLTEGLFQLTHFEMVPGAKESHSEALGLVASAEKQVIRLVAQLQHNI